MSFTYAFATIILLAVPVAQGAIHVLQFTAGQNAPITDHYIVLDYPALNGKPALKPIVTQQIESAVPIRNNHPLGVFYKPAVPPAPASTGRWCIYNEDLAAMPDGARFNVLVPATAKRVDATPLNSQFNFTAILTAKGKPGAILLFTHIFNPYLKLGGGVFVQNQGLDYPASTDAKSPLFAKWKIFNQNVALPPPATSYFVFDTATLPVALGVVRLLHTSTVANLSGPGTIISAPGALADPSNVLFITPVGTTYNKALAVVYVGGSWGIINGDGLTAMAAGQKFNVLMFPGVIP